MAAIDLRYGNQVLPVEFDPARFDVIEPRSFGAPLSDAEIGERLDSPIGSPAIEDIVLPGESVLIVVPDATRRAAAGQVVNLMLRRLIANGTAPHNIRIIFATGIHRPVTDEEKNAILTPFVAQRIQTLDHDPRDLMQLVQVGTTTGGIEVSLNRALIEHDHVVIIGGVTFHYFAGFTGGRKLICPGLAGARTVAATHKLAFDCTTLRRREGVDTAQLDGNAVHEAFVEAVNFRPPAFAVSTIVGETDEAVELYCGDWQASHLAACERLAAMNLVRIEEKREVVIASCGGFPHDINMIQAHKTLDAAARACADGGTIVLLAECRDGLGRADFLDWFEAESSGNLAVRLCEKYKVNGQTAWSLLEKAERFDVRIVTGLPDTAIAKMRLKRMSADALSSLARSAKSGYFLPSGGKTAISGL